MKTREKSVKLRSLTKCHKEFKMNDAYYMVLRIFPKKIVSLPKQLVMTYLVTGYTILWLSSLSNKFPEVQVPGAGIVSWFLSFGNYYEYNGFILKAFKVIMIYWRLNYKLILERIS